MQCTLIFYYKIGRLALAQIAIVFKLNQEDIFFFDLILNPFLSYIRFYLTPSKDTATISKLEK